MAVAVAVSFAGAGAQLLFAAVLILVLGLPHGASDHLVAFQVPTQRRGRRFAGFLAAYGLAIAVTLVVWWSVPGPALMLFLVLSSIHFGLDDLPDEPWTARIGERVARGLMPVTLPALFHQGEMARLFTTLSDDRWGHALAALGRTSSPFVLLLVVFVFLGRMRGGGSPKRSGELIGLAVGLLTLPPLVGFSLYFALVHSRGQTAARMRRLGLPTLGHYLHLIAPTLTGAVALFVLLGAMTWIGHGPATGPLFVGLSALTVPHMLVTPWFEAEGATKGRRRSRVYRGA